jgi:hypothetical protein
MPVWFRTFTSWLWPGSAQSVYGDVPNPFATPTDPSATNGAAIPPDPFADHGAIDPALSDPYHDGQWSPVIAPVVSNPEADQIRADAYVPPYSGPHDLDDYGRETEEMRRAYRDLHRKEPALRSAIDGKAAAVAALDVSVLPRDKNNPTDCAAAAWVKETVEDSPHGWDGLILNILRPAFIDGFSISEKTLKGVRTPSGARWGLAHVKNKDTAHLLLRLDAYRNILGVVNTVRGLRTHDPRKVILFTHADMFDNPFGQSDLRAAYRSANLINDAYQLWHIALKVFSQPFLKGKVADDIRRKQMEAALKAARAAGFLVLPAADDVEVINFATATSFDAFEKKVDRCRQEIYLAVRGAYLPFLEGSGGSDAHGNTGISKHAGSDPVEYLLAKAVGRCLTFQLVPDLVLPNFPAGVGMPRVVLGGVNWMETKQQLEVAATLWEKFGLKTSAKHLYEITQMPPAVPGDEPPGPQVGEASRAASNTP